MTIDESVVLKKIIYSVSDNTVLMQCCGAGDDGAEISLETWSQSRNYLYTKYFLQSVCRMLG